MNVVDVPLAKLTRRTDARRTDQATVQGLMASIQDIGILQPLRVRPTKVYVQGVPDDGYEVTAGSHRFAAAEALNLASVPCIVVDDDELHAELAMLDENLQRAELSPADRARSTARRRAIHLQLHPETAQGVAGAHASNRAQGNASAKLAPAFAQETAAATGRSERAVQRDAERGDSITAAALGKVQGTRLDTGVYLDRLKAVPLAQQLAQVEADLTGNVASEPATQDRASQPADAPLTADNRSEDGAAAKTALREKADAIAASGGRPRTYRNKYGNVAVMDTGRIGRRPTDPDPGPDAPLNTGNVVQLDDRRALLPSFEEMDREIEAEEAADAVRQGPAVDLETVKGRAYAFNGALSTLDLVQITGQEFWSVFDKEPARTVYKTWAMSAYRKLGDIVGDGSEQAQIAGLKQQLKEAKEKARNAKRDEAVQRQVATTAKANRAAMERQYEWERSRADRLEKQLACLRAAAGLDLNKFGKVYALRNGTSSPGERAGADGRLQSMAAAAGLTVEAAVAALSAINPEPIARPLGEEWLDDLEDIFGA